MSAKAKAMFGERLKAPDYQTLLQKKSVAEIASFLKEETSFRSALAGINEKAVHRGQLEALLRMDVLYRMEKLLRYADKGSAKFIDIMVMDDEIEAILSCIRNFSYGDKLMLVSALPTYIEQYMCFDLRKLADITDYASLMELLKGTPFEETIGRYQVKSEEDIDFVGLEHELKLHYYERVIETIDKNTHGKAQKQMEDIYRSDIELDNISIIYRLKKYFQAPPAKIQSLLTPMYCHISERAVHDMIENCSSEEVIQKLSSSYYKRFIAGAKFVYIEHYTKMILYNMNEHFIHTYNEPNLVLLSYLLLSECEIQNVIDIIEGVRYGIGQDQIRELLVY
jgi:V/A-type H+-transporting ATPase subunit C